MIHTLVLDRESRTFTQVPEADAINGLCSNASKIVWVDVSDPTSQDFNSLAKQFGFHPLSIEDCRHEHQRPKVEEFSGYYFIVLYEAISTRRDVCTWGAEYLSWEELSGHGACQPIRAIKLPNACGAVGQTWPTEAPDCWPTF